jgi:hypothetical protein
MVLCHHETQAWPPLAMIIKTLIVFSLRRHLSARETQARCCHPVCSRLELDENVLRTGIDLITASAGLLITLRSNEANTWHADILAVQVAAPMRHHKSIRLGRLQKVMTSGPGCQLPSAANSDLCLPRPPSSSLTKTSGKSDDVSPLIPQLRTDAAMMKFFDRDRVPFPAR